MGAVGQGGDAGGGHLAVLAVVKADHRQVAGDGDPLAQEVGDEAAGDLVVIAHHRVVILRQTLQEPGAGLVGEEGVLGLGAVPQDLLVLEGQLQGAQLVGVAGIALVALNVVGFEDAGDLPAAPLIEVVDQHPAAPVVVVQNGQGAGELRIVAVHKDQGNPPVMRRR